METTTINLNTQNSTPKKKNIFARVWNYYTTLEKVWLLSFWAIGIIVSILFPEDRWWVNLFAVITLMGGVACEQLLSKQSKWAFIVSFFFYDLTQIVVYMANGYYVSALFEVLFWIPMLFISFFSWEKRKDSEDSTKTQVKEFNLKRDLIMFVIVFAISIATGALFTYVGFKFPGFADVSDIWWMDALANTFSVLNGLFLWLRYKEQWIAWYGVAICESILWIMAGQWVMLVLQLGYISNTTYGFIKWGRYIKKHNNQEETPQNAK